ncbi:MAG: hypothetical protein ACI9VS_001547, partial [Candidatus Binatia bacterium]
MKQRRQLTRLADAKKNQCPADTRESAADFFFPREAAPPHFRYI